MITRPITVDKGRWYVQKAGRHWMLYDGFTGEHIRDFLSWEKLTDYIWEQRAKEEKNEAHL